MDDLFSTHKFHLVFVKVPNTCPACNHQGRAVPSVHRFDAKYIPQDYTRHRLAGVPLVLVYP
jgi:hypothetical protein